MPPAIIAHPILNSPFQEPARHFLFADDGITDQVVDGRRSSGYFLPIASPPKTGGQLRFDAEWTQDRFTPSLRINRIRERVGLWRRGGYVGCTRTTSRLLDYWNNPTREKPRCFCQREAVETAISITEVAGRYDDAGSRTSCAPRSTSRRGPPSTLRRVARSRRRTRGRCRQGDQPLRRRSDEGLRRLAGERDARQ